jgi:hypothetical protein
MPIMNLKGEKKIIYPYCYRSKGQQIPKETGKKTPL